MRLQEFRALKKPLVYEYARTGKGGQLLHSADKSGKGYRLGLMHRSRYAAGFSNGAAEELCEGDASATAGAQPEDVDVAGRLMQAAHATLAGTQRLLHLSPACEPA